MLGLFACKKRLGKENAQWITGNYATHSAVFRCECVYIVEGGI